MGNATDAALKLEMHHLVAAVAAFGDEMEAKLCEKAREGWRGWNDPANRAEVTRRLHEHVARGDHQAVDIANLAMMLWYMTQVEEHGLEIGP